MDAVDIGQECDHGARDDGDGCGPDGTVETQVLDGLSCTTAPTPLVFSPGRGDTLVALAEVDTSASTVRDPSCLDPGDESPTVYVSLDVPAGASASISAMGDDGFTPFLCRVTARGAPFSCRIGAPPASGDVIDDIVRPPHGGDLGRAPPAIAGACACEPRSAPTAGCTARSSTRGPKFDPAPAGASRR